MAANPPDRVRIWSAQLAANDFPPVCAMTGRPAETWRKFRFSTAPHWAYAFLLLLCTGVGLLIVFVAMYAVSRRASGHLPLTRTSSRTIGLATWIPGGLVIGTVALWIAAAIVASTSNDPTGQISGWIVIFSALTLLSGIVGLLVVRPMVGPRARVLEQQPGYYDKLVEVRNVHPAFVAALNQMHALRAGQYASGQNSPSLPGSN